jgi:hypothetical protein
VNIFFKRNSNRFCIEQWRFLIKYDIITNNKDKLQYRKIFLIKKLSVLLRSIRSLLKFLPSYSLASNTDFNFILEYDLESINIEGPNATNWKDRNHKKISYSYVDCIGCIRIDSYYLEKTEIFKLEDEMVC